MKRPPSNLINSFEKYETKKPPTEVVSLEEQISLEKEYNVGPDQKEYKVEGYTIDCTDYRSEPLDATKKLGELEADSPEKLQNFTVMFLKNSNKQYMEHEFQMANSEFQHDERFLGAQFCAVIYKIKQEGGEFSTSIRIYYLKNLR